MQVIGARREDVTCLVLPEVRLYFVWFSLFTRLCNRRPTRETGMSSANTTRKDLRSVVVISWTVIADSLTNDNSGSLRIRIWWCFWRCILRRSFHRLKILLVDQWYEYSLCTLNLEISSDDQFYLGDSVPAWYYMLYYTTIKVVMPEG